MTKGIHSPWPTDPSAATGTSSYPSLYAYESSSNNPSIGQESGFGFSIQSVGTDTSPDTSNQDGSGSRQQSNHPTPSTLSNQTSAHTSYTSPPNQSGSSNPANSAQGQPSPGYIYSNTAFNINLPSQLGQGVSPQQSNLNFGSTGMTPGPTGMTPIPDALWPADGIPDGNEWMFSWPGSTPQPQ
ncbi:hypothetical protein CLCR_09178 [Cladophialophora carrionii]|uniref:Uncharacterized protein n=1 Tax=Cladophialophora carrionii TaxID=86049 RepID=A0A1C1CTW8_9EURO|nr:hypothetical protein CLCR_09178 [Cladophialophora carrionii]